MDSLLMKPKKEPTPGFIYIFRNFLNNNLIKVGLSKDPIARNKQLHTTGTELPMTIYHVWHVNNMRLAEQAAHDILSGHRVNNRREFFEIAPLPHFNEFERTNYDVTSEFLYTLTGLIEDGWDYLEIQYREASPKELHDIHYQAK